MAGAHFPQQICALPHVEPVTLPPGLAAPRVSAIQLLREKWPNGKEITYHFLEHPDWTWTEEQRAVIRWGFATWKAIGIGLRFREEGDAGRATLRIGFLPKKSWSWVGREVERYQKPDGRNMNFGWDLRTPWGKATVLHEIGHAIGMPHEHQNPDSGIVWDELEVYRYYAELSEPWAPSEVYENVIRKLDPRTVSGSAWDMHSIMHYPTQPGLIAEPPDLRKNGTPANYALSDKDIEWARRWYPSGAVSMQIRPGEAVEIGAAAGAQREFAITPEETRSYVLRTSGAIDTELELVEIDGEREMTLEVADDSATDGQARLVHELVAGRNYAARVRTIFAKPDATVAFWLE